jgi:VanZ family protein
MKLIKKVFRYWESIIITLGILYLSFAPPSAFKGVPSFPYEDKFVHLFLYSGLTCMLIYDFWKYAKRNNTNRLAFILICLAFPVFLGGAVEILQPIYFAPRTAEWVDWFSDITGVLIGWQCMRFLRKIRILK